MQATGLTQKELTEGVMMIMLSAYLLDLLVGEVRYVHVIKIALFKPAHRSDGLNSLNDGHRSHSLNQQCRVPGQSYAPATLKCQLPSLPLRHFANQCMPSSTTSPECFRPDST